MVLDEKSTNRQQKLFYIVSVLNVTRHDLLYWKHLSLYSQTKKKSKKLSN
jgi:hypothetical protein